MPQWCLILKPLAPDAVGCGCHEFGATRMRSRRPTLFVSRLGRARPLAPPRGGAWNRSRAGTRLEAEE
jgi:hypothetical protein